MKEMTRIVMRILTVIFLARAVYYTARAIVHIWEARGGRK